MGDNLVSMSIVSFRSMSICAYSLAFGALFGVATFGYVVRNSDGSADTGMIYVWTILALVGSTLIGLKNRRIGNGQQRARIYLSDGAVLAGALVLIGVLPSAIGMVKGLVLLALFTAYLVWYFRSLDTFGVD